MSKGTRLNYDMTSCSCVQPGQVLTRHVDFEFSTDGMSRSQEDEIHRACARMSEEMVDEMRSLGVTDFYSGWYVEELVDGEVVNPAKIIKVPV